MEWTALILCGICAVLFWIFTRSSSNRSGKKTPPEQGGVPILGYVPFLKPNRYVAFTELKKKLGDIFMVRLFNERVLVLNSLESIREALVTQSHVFSSRPNFRYVDSFAQKKGLVFTSGDFWQSHRRFVLRALRELGFGKAESVKAIHTEISTMVDFIESSQNKPVKSSSLFPRLTSNVICALVFGENFSENPNHEDLLKYVDGLTEVDSHPIENLPNFFPFMMDIPFVMSIFHRFAHRKRYYLGIINFMLEMVIKHKSTLDQVSQPNNIIDVMLLHRQALEEKGESNHYFDDRSIAADLLDLFGAGSDTTSTTLSWAVVLMSFHPEIQRRAREEIKSEIGMEQLPTMKDKSKLHYVSAVIDEVSRFASIVPTSVFHITDEDTTLFHYHIPKNTQVFPNLYAVHMDPKNWANPSKFDPNHFLTKDEIYQPSDYLIPFSLGKRACLGESLARMEVFIFVVALLQRYEVSLSKEDEGNVDEILKGDDGLVRHLMDHKVLFKATE